MKNLKESKAITLIALIITIIVLLILAGVVINMTLGNDGIISKAQGVVDAYKNAQEKEEIEIAKVENEINNYSRDTVTISKEEYEMLKNANLYSTEEKVVGTWINGKKLYRKVISFSKSSSTTTVPTGITNGENARIIDGYLLSKDGWNIPLWYYNGENYYNAVCISPDGSSLFNSGAGMSGLSGYFIVEYTKTTDSTPTT